MKSISEMREIAKQFLTDNGFEQDNFFQGGDTYHFPNMAEIKTEIRFNRISERDVEWRTYEGRSIRVTELYRSNGTEANQSIQFEVIDWHESSGKVVFREKLYARHGAKKTASVLTSVVNAYHG